MAYQRKKDGVYFSPSAGRLVQHKGRSTAIYWSPAMLDYLRRHFPTTLNAELAECLGVGQRSMTRKARELGLEKDPDWLMGVYAERQQMAHSASRRKGYPGAFQKGVRANPAGEFKKGEVRSPEVRRKIGEAIRRWCRTHPDRLKERARKTWETRRSKTTTSTT